MLQFLTLSDTIALQPPLPPFDPLPLSHSDHPAQFPALPGDAQCPGVSYFLGWPGNSRALARLLYFMQQVRPDVRRMNLKIGDAHDNATRG
ncbi:hypothetical protein C8Q77DRAFT_1125931 [Trametes polyzona]|nr:hypothetical protein C8Q77DRAFT_1125931 [Trametes polyzona]